MGNLDTRGWVDTLGRILPIKRFIKKIKKKEGEEVLTSLTAAPTLRPITALDITVSCPLLPSYVSACAASASRIISLRASEKIRHHLPGCLQLGRAFLPIDRLHHRRSDGAVGPRPFLSFVRRAFDAAAAREVLDGGRGCLARYRSSLFFASLHAALARATSAMLCDRLFRPATAGPGVSPARAATSAPGPSDSGSAAATACDDDSDAGDSDSDAPEPGCLDALVDDASPGSVSDADV